MNGIARSMISSRVPGMGEAFDIRLRGALFCLALVSGQAWRQFWIQAIPALVIDTNAVFGLNGRYPTNEDPKCDRWARG